MSDLPPPNSAPAVTHTGRQILKNSFWLMTEQGLRVVSGVIVAALIARYLGPDQFGLINYALSIIAFLSGGVGLGLDTIVIRELATTPAGRNHILGSTVILRVVAGLVAMVAAPLIVMLLQPEARLAILLTAIMGLTLPLQAIDTLELPFHSILKSRTAVAGRSLGVVGTLVFRTALLIGRADLVWFAAAFLAEKPLGAIVLLRRLRAAGERVRDWRFDRGVARMLLQQGWPLMISGLIVMVYMRSDQVLITGMLGAAANGLYSAAVRLVEQVFVIPVIFSRSLAPKAIQLDDAAFMPYVRRVAARMVWGGIALALILAVASDPLVRLLYGAAYAPAVPVLRLLSLNIVFLAYTAARSMIVLRLNLFRFDTVYIGISAAANVGLNYLLIPRYGIEGAVVGSLFAQAGMIVLLPLLHPRTRILGTTFFKSFVGSR